MTTPEPIMYLSRPIEELLTDTRTVAFVGVSPNPERYSHKTAKYLQSQGYRVIPVNPGADEILGEKAYADLSQVPDRLDMVYIVRNPKDVPPLVDQAISMGAKTVWMHEEVVNEEAGRKAEEAGLDVVMNR